ncbi:hypothetical protein ACIRU3_00730 [Streptomyces sp. NPDC101151]|uniref:hypothetical protein n=1 Tax=Streptomyces sp. NPDC101151 TaxID=3366115 RepID=UPI0037F10CF5
MARHSSSPHPTAQRALVVLATASAALGVGATTASADAAAVAEVPWQPASLGRMDPGAGFQASSGSVRYVTGPVPGFDPVAFARAGAQRKAEQTEARKAARKNDGGDDPLSGLTGPVTQTGSLGAVPALERFAGLLGGGGTA